MKHPVKYYGPYLYRGGTNKGRQYMTVLYSDGSRGTTLYSRYLMQEKLGRRLKKTETVGHKNEDPSDDRIDNFQLLSQPENASKSSSKRFKITWFEFICPVCKTLARKDLRVVKANQKRGYSGPFRKCACAHQFAKR
jgi:hypothetical protein